VVHSLPAISLPVVSLLPVGSAFINSLNGTPMGTPATANRNLNRLPCTKVRIMPGGGKLPGVPERAVLSKPPKPQCALVTADDGKLKLACVTCSWATTNFVFARLAMWQGWSRTLRETYRVKITRLTD